MLLYFSLLFSQAINFSQHISIYRSRSKNVVSLHDVGTYDSQYHLDICCT